MTASVISVFTRTLATLLSCPFPRIAWFLLDLESLSQLSLTIVLLLHWGKMSQAADEGKSSASSGNEEATNQFEKTLKHDVSALKKEYSRLVAIEEIPAEKLPEDIKKQSFSQKIGTLAEGVGSVCFSLIFTGEPHMKLYVLADTRGYTVSAPVLLSSSPIHWLGNKDIFLVLGSVSWLESAFFQSGW